jgi:sugar lactone lactonase YvrE
MATGTIPTCPQWSPDGTRFFITAQELGGYQVYAFWLEGDDPGEPLFLHQVAGPVAPDGRTLLVGDTHGNLYRAGIDGRQHQFIAAVGRVSPVAWSADGSLIAMPFYIMSADGRYARNVDGEILGFAP